jgi:8-oxo-dGTP diphosphatase
MSSTVTQQQDQLHQPPTVVRVGVGVLVKDPLQPSKIFCGIRKGSHGAGSLALPGGHLELYESWEDCARREVLEECDLQLGSAVRFAHVSNDPMPAEGKHYVTIFMMGECESSLSTLPLPQPKTMEPEKCEGWKSYSWDQLQALGQQGRLFGPLQRLVVDSPSNIMEFLET